MLLTIVVFLIVLSILILVHELGHFLMAKRVGIKVEEFGFGYPPRLFSKKIGETVYSLNLLPFGGFVRLHGEELAEKVKESKRAFWAKSKKARTVVIIAGVLANFLLAVVVFSVVYSVIGIPTQTDQVIIIGVVPDSPAAEVNLKEEDIILAVDEETLRNLDHFVELIEKKKGKEVSLLVRREEKEMSFSLVPRESPPSLQPTLADSRVASHRPAILLLVSSVQCGEAELLLLHTVMIISTDSLALSQKGMVLLQSV